MQIIQSQEPTFNASSWNIGLVVAQFNHEITDQLYQGALKRAADYRISPDAVTTLRVAGAIELPLALQHLAQQNRYQALLAIGCVINGETPHFEYVCQFVTQGVLRVQLDHSVPIGFGILTCQNLEQAEARAHLGGDHLDAALQLARAIGR